MPIITLPKQTVKHDTPGITCQKCGQTFTFGDWVRDDIGWSYIEARWEWGCSCGGRFEFKTSSELDALEAGR